MKTPVLSVSHVSKIYEMDGISFTALDDVSMTIGKGEFVAITGPSGSGKSTLMHLIGCLDTPTRGTISIDGIETATANEKSLARLRNQKIGFVFQQFNLLRKTSALANVELPLVYAGTHPQKRKEEAIRVLTMVGLAQKLKNFPSQLSGGQQQRVAIARALVTDPAILLADEPTGNLDSKSGKEVLELFESLHKEGRTIILVTHDQTVAAHARRTIRIEDGRIIDTKSQNSKSKSQINAQ